jgi:hypothetical protein
LAARIAKVNIHTLRPRRNSPASVAGEAFSLRATGGWKGATNIATFAPGRASPETQNSAPFSKPILLNKHREI